MGAVMTTTTEERLGGARHGALVGLLVGIALAAFGEAGAAIIRATAYMADVGIIGLTAVFGIPSSVVLGALLGWWGRPVQTTLLALAAAIPAALAAVAHLAIQASAV